MFILFYEENNCCIEGFFVRKNTFWTVYGSIHCYTLYLQDVTVGMLACDSIIISKAILGMQFRI